ncbi:hypothetical protein CAG64_05540 [Vibrio sp. V38_P2S17PM301]|nr:hypothetical protein [Vibrio sp. V38_P2S17PM301]
MMKNYIRSELAHFSRWDFTPSRQVALSAIGTFASWFIPAFLFVLWASHYFPEHEFYKKTIDEGKAPNFWNAIAVLGLFLACLVLMFPRFDFLKSCAISVLNNTYSIGCLTLGLLLGQWFFLPWEALIWWQQGLFAGGSLFLVVIALIINFWVWYIAYLLSEQSSFLEKFMQMKIWQRVVIALFFVSVVILVGINA